MSTSPVQICGVAKVSRLLRFLENLRYVDNFAVVDNRAVRFECAIDPVVRRV